MKSGNSGEKWGKVGKSGEELEKVGKSREKYGKSGEMWLGMVICDFMWLKVDL